MDNKVSAWSRLATISFVKTFMAVFVPVTISLMVFHLYMYQGKKRHALHVLTDAEVHRVTLLAETLRDHFDWISADINYIAHRYMAASLAATNPDLVLAGIENDFLVFCREKKIYDQIVVIDLQGREQLRINYNGGAAYAVSPNELQNKSLRYYVKDCLALGPGNIYISPLDLNVEHGEVEVPFKPIIRIGRALLDSQGRKAGMILLSYYGDHLLKHVSAESAHPHHNGLDSSVPAMLVNGAGYWLVAPDKEDEWGFMFAHRRGRTFAKRYPTEWQHMGGEESGHLRTANGFFAFAAIKPPLASGGVSLGKIISFVPAKGIGPIVYRQRASLYPLALLHLSLAAAVSLLVAILVGRKKRYQQDLEHLSLADPLTGLLNRRAFQQRLEQETDRADRYGGRLFMILGDIDHFKGINDSHGHDAGDFILKKIAATLAVNLRSTDVLCRWGGEEFMVLVSGYTKEDGEKVAEKLRKAVEDEVIWFNNPRLKVTMSFGVCAHRKKMTMEELLKCSDEMLYASKRNGRNQVTAEKL